MNVAEIGKQSHSLPPYFRYKAKCRHEVVMTDPVEPAGLEPHHSVIRRHECSDTIIVATLKKKEVIWSLERVPIRIFTYFNVQQ